MNLPTESGYQVSFRQPEARLLGEHLRAHNSVVIIGMKRVGISNFLRFFLYHPKIEETYIHNGVKHIFIPVDLHDLVERDLYPFWTLTLKRIVDTIASMPLKSDIIDVARRYFTESIQLHDLFFTVDSIRKTIALIGAKHYYPTIFFIRFDRMKDAITPEFFENLQGLKDAVHNYVSLVFTTYRPLTELSPGVFYPPTFFVFCQNMYIKPATDADMTIILDTFLNRYSLKLSAKIRQALIRWSGGHVQYLHISLIRLKSEKVIPDDLDMLFKILVNDEEISRQSEELFESLSKTEQSVVFFLAKTGKINGVQAVDYRYLTETGIIIESDGTNRLFNTFFSEYIKQNSRSPVSQTEFTNKEYKLYSILLKNFGNIVERDDIINAVWPESSEMGVSDWAVDRLVARVRLKLKIQKSPYGILTVITRGFKLLKQQ